MSFVVLRIDRASSEESEEENIKQKKKHDGWRSVKSRSSPDCGEDERRLPCLPAASSIDVRLYLNASASFLVFLIPFLYHQPLFALHYGFIFDSPVSLPVLILKDSL